MLAPRTLRLLACVICIAVVAGAGLYIGQKASRVEPQLRTRIRLVGALERGIEVLRNAAAEDVIGEDLAKASKPHQRELEARLAAAGLTLLEDRVQGVQRSLALSFGAEGRGRFVLEEAADGLRYVRGTAVLQGDSLEFKALLDGVRGR